VCTSRCCRYHAVAVDALTVDAKAEVRRAKDRAMARATTRLDETRRGGDVGGRGEDRHPPHAQNYRALPATKCPDVRLCFVRNRYLPLPGGPKFKTQGDRGST